MDRKRRPVDQSGGEARRVHQEDRTLAHIRDIIARLPDEALSLAPVFKKEAKHSIDLDRLVELMIARAKALAAVNGSETMQPADLRVPRP